MPVRRWSVEVLDELLREALEKGEARAEPDERDALSALRHALYRRRAGQDGAFDEVSITIDEAAGQVVLRREARHGLKALGGASGGEQ